MHIIIDGNKITDKESLHETLKEKLVLPDYYGSNLDALWDCLTGWIELPTTIEWKNYSESEIRLGDYANKVLETFKEAQEELDGFQIDIN